MDGNVVQIPPSDKELAAQARAELAPILQALCDALNKYRAHGLVLNANCPVNGFGRHAPAAVEVFRPY